MAKQFLIPALILVALAQPAVCGETWSSVDRGWPSANVNGAGHDLPNSTNSRSQMFATAQRLTFRANSGRQSEPAAAPAERRGFLDGVAARFSTLVGDPQAEKHFWVVAMSIGWWSLASFWAVRSWLCGGR